MKSATSSNSLPPIWIIVLIVGLVQFCETVYSPSLPDIALGLNANISTVEHTLTIFILGMGIGTLFWGILSDKIGRKPCVISGFIIFVIGCIWCYFSTNVAVLMLGRFIQAFGSSVGAALGQAISRDSFDGPKLGQVFSLIGTSLAVFPAVGPIIGGLIAEYLGWRNIFIFLTYFGVLSALIIICLLPETNHKNNRNNVVIIEVIMSLIKNKKVLLYGFIVGGCNGISFSYFAEGPFYMIKFLGISPSEYGLTFVAISVASVIGGMLSYKLQNFYTQDELIKYGLIVVICSSMIFSCFAITKTYFKIIDNWVMIWVVIVSQLITRFGLIISTVNSLALSLTDYKTCIGTASSLFGFYYYCLISMFNFGMGELHNDTLLPMPLYFCSIAIFMLLIKRHFCEVHQK